MDMVKFIMIIIKFYKLFNLIKGKIEYSNGDIYEGEFNEIGLKNGKGIMKYNNGKIYDGNWENNKKNGNGLLCCNNEDYEKIINARISEININNIFKLKLNDSFYEGEFVNDLREGKGILFNKYGDHYLNNNLIYYGNFRNILKMNFILDVIGKIIILLMNSKKDFFIYLIQWNL